ncbi:heterokaryon incompatibility protein-domain-containing protein [Lasiosphaeris hirsuta]|uniref:Heterokaryon incompatibility protein-domain-containing protein n=1 Tax=Lasiosphaeris hirsuta TaxID=260670 RepID=A0AA40AZH1_9PEZI|nr:heterokaryon incompatibility protein-domain-containing protein [Lasiosphaeris hirsuta]
MTSAGEETLDSDHDVPPDASHDDIGTESSLLAKRGRYHYLKCTTCRQKKKKCEPVDRVWPARCNLCVTLSLECSPPEAIRERPAGVIHPPLSPLGPRAPHGKITKFPKPHRTSGSGSTPLISSAGRHLLPTSHPPALGESLCERCQRLEISQARFLASAPRAGLGKAEEGIPRQRISLGLISQVRANLERCRFCCLVWKAALDQLRLANRHTNDLDAGISVHATWEIDGRRQVSLSKNDDSFFEPVTRHIRLSWDTPDLLNDAYVVLCGDDPRVVGVQPAFLGRRIINLTQAPAVMVATTNRWINHCNSHHRNCRPTELTPLRPSQHLRVVDVGNVKLVPLTESMDYVVLSYTWEAATERPLQRNFKDSWHDLGLQEVESQLPQTIRDAIKFVRNFGKQYLWIDSLCIVQDDELDKRENYSVIDRIFANSALTICAVRSSFSDPMSTQGIGQHILDCGEKMSLMVHHPLETYVQSSPWSQGAWTCQDRLLSGRCLIFTESRVWFQCQEESMSEDIFESSFQGCSADWVQSPAQIWSDLKQSNAQLNFRGYIKCVESYTCRKLPREDHALRAFEGISHFLGAYFKTRFFSGLPSSYFDVAMLWTPASSGTALRTYQGQQVAPSWSWASWTGQATYGSPIVTGAVENIDAWLREHTWISWFLVDRHSVIGEIGTYAKSDLADRADGREPSPKETGSRFIRVASRETRWPSLNRFAFNKTVPALSSDRMDTDAAAPVYFLQFWTWSAHFRLGVSSDGGETGVHAAYSTPRIHRYNILDCNTDICGSIVLPDHFAQRIESQRQYEFIALADAKSFRQEELPEWTFYIPKERDDSFWDLWYVLLLETDDGGLSRRVGLGKVFKDAFHQSFQPGRDWREFILA